MRTTRNASSLSSSEQSELGRCYGLDQPYLNTIFPRWRDIAAVSGWNPICLGQWGNTICGRMQNDAVAANLTRVSRAAARKALYSRHHVHLSPLGIECVEVQPHPPTAPTPSESHTRRDART